MKQCKAWFYLAGTAKPDIENQKPIQKTRCRESLSA